ncbi:MAG TPA: NADH-quinone oxidoreductase subunit NuoF [Polyangia bacterium]|jgi:NADH-quinone oxidoreductase subunit F
MEPILTRNIGPGRTPPALKEYEAAGGYAALRDVVPRRPPATIVQAVLDSGLRGRGGAGFPTGVKWKALPPLAGSARPRVLACNYDEMEPGTYKDRFLVEGDPHQLIEGMILAAWACQCDVGYIFVRGEYRRSLALLEHAVGEAAAAGYVGGDVLGSGWRFDLHLHESAGRYMCGEETGLLNALEGRRATPRAKPPFPMTVGAWGLPTVVNNVETLCNVPHIAARGADWFKGLGRAKDSGTKIYGMSGRVKRPHCVELPMGTPLRELLDEMGGMQDGYRFRAALPGGASTRFLGPDQLDVPLDFASLAAINRFLGTGTAVVLDDHTCVVDLARNLERFYARESCGWCTPCREGLPWLEAILADLHAGRGRPGDVELIEEQGEMIGPHTFCALATGAIFPLESSLELFRDEYEDHIRLGRCPLDKGTLGGSL